MGKQKLQLAIQAEPFSVGGFSVHRTFDGAFNVYLGRFPARHFVALSHIKTDGPCFISEGSPFWLAQSDIGHLKESQIVRVPLRHVLRRFLVEVYQCFPPKKDRGQS